MNRTVWDRDHAGPGTETNWDGGSTLWDLLPSVLGAVVSISVQFTERLSSRFTERVKP